MSKSLETEILKTIHYADVFNYPLTVEEIKKYLVGQLKDLSIEKGLSQTVADDKLTYVDGYYGLHGREEIVELRKKRQKYSWPKLKKARRLASILSYIPWIKLIGVTGALAMENSDEEDDIDLMIVGSSKRLWLTRALVVITLKLTRQYRRSDKVRDKICPNLFISEDVLEVKPHNLYTAHEVVQMKPIFERGNAYQEFLGANLWVKKFLPGAVEISNLNCQIPNPKINCQNFLFDFLESLVYKIQLKYMSRKDRKRIVGQSLIHFLDKDDQPRVLKEYQKHLDTLRNDA